MAFRFSLLDSTGTNTRRGILSMPLKAKAYCFWVRPKEGNAAEEIAKLLSSFARKDKPLRLQTDTGDVHLCDAHWRKDGDSQVFTATAFKLRKRALPSVVSADGVEPLELDAEKALGEPTCFALNPVEEVAAVFQALHGPAPSVIRACLKDMGFPRELDFEPVLLPDIMERLERTRFVRSLSFSLKDVPGGRRLRRAGLPVERAIELADSVEGVDVSVTVSIGRQKRSLAIPVIKQACTILSEIGDTNLGMLRLSASESEEEKCRDLDILKGRIEYEIAIPDALRQLDLDGCQRQLVAVLKEALPDIKKQKTP